MARLIPGGARFQVLRSACLPRDATRVFSSSDGQVLQPTLSGREAGAEGLVVLR